MELPQIFINTPENRQWLARIVLGKESVPSLEFFATLQENPNDILRRDCSAECVSSPGTSYNIDNEEIDTPSTAKLESTNIHHEQLEYGSDFKGTGTSNPTKPSKPFVDRLKLLFDLTIQYEDEQSLGSVEKLIQGLKQFVVQIS